jgi:hypothetical protein
MEINLILGVLGLYAISRLYSSVTGKTPSSRFNLSELKEAFQKNSGVWWFMVPISGILILFFEAVVSVLWFLGEILQLGTALIKLLITIVKWIYNEVVLGGFYFLWKLIWHYLICIPWKWFLEAFSLLGAASKWSSYKIATIGIFASLIVAFLGRYVNSFLGTDHMTIQSFIQQGTTLLSIIPIGMAASMIAFNRKNSGATWKVQGLNYAKIAAAILVPMIALIGLEYLLINVGSRTSFQFSISTLLAGGSLFASFLILINSILIIFVISALPSFANAYSGDLKGVYRAFLNHLYYGWVSYLLAIPAIIIPAFILSIIPGLVTQGMTYFTQKATDYVYEQRIASITEDSKENMVPYSDWCNVDSISNDSLNKLMEADMRMLSVRVALNGVGRGQAYLDSSYSSFANRNGAVTVGLLAYMYNSYADMVNENLKAQPMNTEADSDSSFASEAKGFQAQVAEMDSAVVKNNKSIASWQEEKAAVCSGSALVVEIPEPPVVNEPQPPIVQEPVADIPSDACDAERMRIDGIIADIQAENTKIGQMKERQLAVISHLNKMQEDANGMVGNEKVAKHLGYFFMSIWMCALAAIAMGFVLSIYSHLNNVVFNSIDNSEWLITTQIRDAHNANKNQPILGLILTFVASLMIFGMVSSMDLTAPKAIWEKAKAKGIEMLNTIPGMSGAVAAPAPSSESNEVAQEIQESIEQIEEPAPVDTTMQAEGPADAIVEMYKINSPQGYANLREIPDGMIIREVYPNELFTILGELDGFYGVELQDGTKGFIQSTLVMPAY